MAIVLIATMDNTDFTILAAEVEGEGHSVLWAADGNEAVDLTLAHQPALVFLDTALPVFNAFEVADILRGDPDVAKALPLVVFTDEAIEPHRFENAGFTALFPKTHAHQEVREVLSRLVPSQPLL